VAALAEKDPETTAFIERYERRQRRAGEAGRVAWRRVPYDRISPHLKRAVLVAEDIDFFSHDGFAAGEIRTAIREAIEEREFPRGASTITQQLAKNLWLSPSRNPWRKLEEAILTRQLEAHLAKRRILELYLNVAEFGPGIFGAEAAARHYFGKPAAALSPWEAASLAAGLPNPGRWHPGSGSAAGERRAARIRRRMEKAAWLWKEI
jgi:monofunctional biosynthetic peptidoglycan transglycosylase